MEKLRKRFTGERNVGRRDRLARAVLAVGFLALAGMALTDGRTLLAAGSVVVAVGLAVNVLTAFCGLNAVLGVDTCNWDGDT